MFGRVPFSARLMFGGLGAFIAGGIAFKSTLWDGSLDLLPCLGLGSLGVAGGVGLMALGAYLFKQEYD